jgi:hypothetical protein
LWRSGANLYRIVGACIALFLVLTPGFGIQYLEWILPFSFVFGRSYAMVIYGSASLFLFSMYTRLSGGFPWYFADMFRPDAAKMTLLISWETTVCWIVLILGLVSMIPGVVKKRT